MKKVLIYFFFLFCFFPFLDFLRIGTDTQPNALLLAVLPLAMCFRKRLPVAVYLFGGTFCVALLLLAFSPITFNSFRDVANYFSVFAVSWATYLAFYHIKKLRFDFFVVVNFIWLFVGMVQTYLYPYFMTFLLNGGGRGIDSESRGVTSLATEPSQYGIICLFLMAIGLLNFPFKKVWWVVLLAFIQLLLLAQSATSLLALVVGLGGFIGVKLLLFNRRALVYAMAIVMMGYVTYQLTYETLKEQRVYTLATELAENPELFIVADGSVSERFMFVYFSFKGMVDNHFLPRGYNQFNSYMQEEINKPREGITKMLLSYTRDDYSRILCGMGSVFFQLGALGLGILFGIIACFRRRIFEDKFLFSLMLTISILFTAFALMTAILGFLLGNAMYLSRRQDNSPSSPFLNSI